MIQRIFPELAPTHSTNFRFIYFHSLMKSAFLLSKGLLCLYDKQNNTWLLLDMEFLFSCATRQLTRELFHIVRPCIILYLSNGVNERSRLGEESTRKPGPK